MCMLLILLDFRKNVDKKLPSQVWTTRRWLRLHEEVLCADSRTEAEIILGATRFL